MNVAFRPGPERRALRLAEPRKQVAVLLAPGAVDASHDVVALHSPLEYRIEILNLRLEDLTEPGAERVRLREELDSAVIQLADKVMAAEMAPCLVSQSILGVIWHFASAFWPASWPGKVLVYAFTA